MFATSGGIITYDARARKPFSYKTSKTALEAVFENKSCYFFLDLVVTLGSDEAALDSAGSANASFGANSKAYKLKPIIVPRTGPSTDVPHTQVRAPIATA